ncbi:unnamed protein product [Pylaiella littoralis]
MSSRPALTGSSWQGARSRQQGPLQRRHPLPQTKQRHANAKALEHNARLRSENEVLRSQNAHLARELNDLKAKYQGILRQKTEQTRRLNRAEFDLRRHSEARTHGAATNASPSPPPAARSSRSAATASPPFDIQRKRDDESDGRASGSRGGQVTEDHQRAAHSHTQGGHGDDKADSEVESSAVGRAIAEQPSSGSRGGTKATTAPRSPAGVPVSPTSGGGEDVRSAEAVHRIEDETPLVFTARRARRRCSILPSNAVEDFRRGEQLSLRGRLSLAGLQGDETQLLQQQRTPSPPSTKTQPQPPYSHNGAASRSLGIQGSGSSSGRGGSRSLELSSSGRTGGAARSLDLLVGGGGGSGSSNSNSNSNSSGVQEQGYLPENAVFWMDSLEGADGGDELSRSSIDAIEVSSAETRSPTIPSRSSRLLLQPPSSEEFRYPDGDELEGSVNTSRRRPSSRGLDLPGTARRASLGGSAARMGLSEGTEAADTVAATRATGAAGQRTAQRGASSFPPEGSPLLRPTARPRPLASTPLPSMNLTPSSNPRPRRAVAKPVTYEEPSLKFKMRKGHVMFPKSRHGTTDGLPETGLAEEKENERDRRRGEGKS